MILPWLITIRPFVIPSDARAELMTIAEGLTVEEFSDKIWQRRVEASPAVRKSHRKKWPIKRAESNVTRLPVRTRKQGRA